VSRHNPDYGALIPDPSSDVSGNAAIVAFENDIITLEQYTKCAITEKLCIVCKKRNKCIFHNWQDMARVEGGAFVRECLEYRVHLIKGGIL